MRGRFGKRLGGAPLAVWIAGRQGACPAVEQVVGFVCPFVCRYLKGQSPAGLVRREDYILT